MASGPFDKHQRCVFTAAAFISYARLPIPLVPCPNPENDQVVHGLKVPTARFLANQALGFRANVDAHGLATLLQRTRTRPTAHPPASCAGARSTNAPAAAASRPAAVRFPVSPAPAKLPPPPTNGPTACGWPMPRCAEASAALLLFWGAQERHNFRRPRRKLCDR